MTEQKENKEQKGEVKLYTDLHEVILSERGKWFIDQVNLGKVLRIPDEAIAKKLIEELTQRPRENFFRSANFSFWLLFFLCLLNLGLGLFNLFVK